MVRVAVHILEKCKNETIVGMRIKIIQKNRLEDVKRMFPLYDLCKGLILFYSIEFFSSQLFSFLHSNSHPHAFVFQFLIQFLFLDLELSDIHEREKLIKPSERLTRN